MFIDTHAHLDDAKYSDKSAVVKAYETAGVNVVVNMGCDIKTSKESLALSERFNSVYFAVGFHPEYAEEFSEDGLKTLKELVKHEKCLAIGEIGLDYHYEGFDREKQGKAFLSQIALANDLGLPVSVHSRDATADTLELFKGNKELLKNGFIMHCFSGSKETAKEYLDLGGYLGFGGTVTFKNSVRVKEVAAYCPIDRLLTETDSPYLAPEPKRGTVNLPENIPIIAGFIANLRGIGTEELEIAVEKNAKRIFKKL